MRVIKATILALMLGLTGCTTIEYIEKPVPYQREPLGITSPSPLTLNVVTVTLWTPEGKPAYFVINPDSYQNMLLNNKLIEGYIRESGSRIEACEAYYTAPMEIAE